MSTALQRALAQALLPASIIPVLVLGPGLVRAPQTLWRRSTAEVRRLLAAPAQRGHHQTRRAVLARERQGVPGAGVRRKTQLFPGARYAPLRGGLRGAPPSGRALPAAAGTRAGAVRP